MNLGCREKVSMTHEEYEAVRGDPRRFFVVPGHETVAGASGRVVERHESHVVVEVERAR
jgi:hypothetical protein